MLHATWFYRLHASVESKRQINRNSRCHVVLCEEPSACYRVLLLHFSSCAALVSSRMQQTAKRPLRVGGARPLILFWRRPLAIHVRSWWLRSCCSDAIENVASRAIVAALRLVPAPRASRLLILFTVCACRVASSDTSAQLC